MKESVTYQAILEEGEALGKLKGKIQEARHVLLLQGRRRFGAPAKKVQKTLSGIDDLARLERVLVRIHEVDAWDSLLQTP